MTVNHQLAVADQRPSRTPGSARLVYLLALALIAAACGSYHSEEDLLAATRGVGGSGDAAFQAAPSGIPSSTTPGQDATQVDVVSGGDPEGSSAAGGGGSSPEPTTPVAGGRGQQGTECTGSEEALTIASVGQQSGVFGPFMQPITHGVQAWVAATNSQGGLACHPIEFIVRDDGGDPSVHQSQVQGLVEQEDVIAFVGTTSVLTGGSSLSYLTSKGVPVIGNEGGSEWFYESPVYFPQVTTGNTALAALVGAVGRVGEPQGMSKLAVVTCLEAALCSSLFGEAEELARKAGLELVDKAQASLTQLDFTSICQRFDSRGAEMMIIGLDTNSIQRVLRNCQSIGFRPLAITGGPLVTPGLLEDPRAEGFLVSSATDLYTSSNPSVVAYRDALATHAPGLQPSIASLAGWTAAELFGEGLRRAPEATRAGLLEGLRTVKDNDLGGLTYPLSFTAGQTAPRVSCVWIGQVKDGSLVPAAGAPPGRFCE